MLKIIVSIHIQKNTKLDVKCDYVKNNQNYIHKKYEGTFKLNNVGHSRTDS